jgi:two-component system LytT family sensor kinase
MSNASFVITRSKQFWIFQLFGWTTWVFIVLLFDLLSGLPQSILDRVLVFGLSAVAGIIITAGLRLIYRLAWEKGFIVRFLIGWFGSTFAALIWTPIRTYITQTPVEYMIIFSSANDLSSERLERLNLYEGVEGSLLLMLTWSALYFIIKYYQLLQAEQEKRVRSEALAHEAQLLMLRYQLNPHFLFNTLNAISTLVLARSTEQANQMLIKLSKFLRYSLDHSSLAMVSLAHELEISRLYLDIEKVRFGERLKLDFDISADSETALVPTLILQPLIENCIKHGLSKSESGGEIRISAKAINGLLSLEVSDNGPGLPTNAGLKEDVVSSSGVGISNIRNRLNAIYSSNHELAFSNASPHGLTVTIEIPYE